MSLMGFPDGNNALRFTLALFAADAPDIYKMKVVNGQLKLVLRMVSGHLSFITIWLSGMDLYPKALRR